MFYYATLYADGTPVVRPLHPKDLRSEEALVLYANKLSSNVDFHAVRSLFDAADDWAGSKAIREAHARDLKRVNNILELGWHRQPLISFYCTHCSEVKDICHFPDCQRSSYPHGHPYLDGRTCLPCAFAMSPNGSRELFTLNSTAHKPCINCGKIDAESAFGPPDHDDGTTHEGVSACHMCHATKKAKGWALKFNRYGWEDFDVLDIFDYKAYVDSKGKVEQTLDGTTLAEAFDSHYAARALASKATDAAMGS